MNARIFLWSAAITALVCAGGSPATGVAAVHHAGVCGSLAASRALLEPPDVEIAKLPRNASGEHELILTVAADRSRYCYRYVWNGAVQTVAPTIRVRRDEHFALRVVNDLAGQSRAENVASSKIPACRPMGMAMTPTSHYVGYLNHTIDDEYMGVRPIDTNLHLHGFEGPAAEENVFLSTLSSPLHACEYHITIPRTQPPGTYIYHPHAHGASDVEVAEGLTGAWIVEPDKSQLPRSSEHVIVLRYRTPFQFDNLFVPDEDALATEAVAHEAALRPGRIPAYNPFDPPPWPVTFPMSAGGVTLDPSGCNGLSSEPLIALNGSDEPANLQLPAGETQLLRIINGTSDSAKVFVLRDSSGREQPLRVVGLDGIPVSGDMEHPLSRYIAMKKLRLTAMSRADVLLTADAGERYTISSEHYCEGKDAFFQMHRNLLEIEAIAAAAQGIRLNSQPAIIAETPAARLVAFARANPALVRRRAITFTEYAFPKRGKIAQHDGFYLTDTTSAKFNEHPYWPAYAKGGTVPSNPDVVVRKGTMEEWYLINATMEAHAFHIHQMTFVQESSPAGMPLTGDTAFVPVGKLLRNRADPNYPLVKPSITRILLDFRHVPRGTFVFHCHMLFHEDRGMMATIKVE